MWKSTGNVASKPAPSCAGYYYVVMRGGVEPSVSSKFTTTDARDEEVSKILSDDENKPVEYDEACDSVMKLDIDRNGVPEMWAAAGA